MRRVLCVLLVVVGAVVAGARPAVGQTPVGALAIDERQGDRWGWAVDYETAESARAAAQQECGAGCSVVLTFARCGAYAADQTAGSTAYGWGESYASADGARERALTECGSRGGSRCVVRAWGCNGPVAEEGLRLDRSARREIQLGLQTAGFDPGGADGLFGPRTRAAIRDWQSSRGARATGYLDGPAAEALQTADASGQTVVAVAGPVAAPVQAAAAPVVPADVAEAETNLEHLDPVTTGFSPDHTCADLPREGSQFGVACWMEVAQHAGCYVWTGNQNLDNDASVTWTGECVGGMAQGIGVLTWTWDDRWTEEGTGQLDDGKHTGHWVHRYNGGAVNEGPYVAGKRHGHWVVDYESGAGAQGPFVDGLQHGLWVVRRPDGSSHQVLWVNGRVQLDAPRRPDRP